MPESMDERDHARDVVERSETESRAASAPLPGGVALPPTGTSGRHYTAGEKAQALRAYAASGAKMRAWCSARGISTATLCAWRRAYARGGDEALEPRANPRNRGGATGQRHYSPEERRATLAAYHKSGMTQVAFCRLWGLSPTSLQRWNRAYRLHGPKGLESPWGTGRRGRKKQPVAPAVRAEIAAAKRRYPWWGVRRIRDALARFSGVRVGVHRVREVVREEGLETPRPVKKARRAPPRPRRFERARPRELWQSDITSYVLTRHSQRVYLTVFLDDHSRYVVSFALALQQRSELVTECLLEGLARFGKPKEVLTDQGRQYFAWRGKSRFQKLLIREGIQHVVSRAHHPQTLGKCERLWQTVGCELWERARPQDLDEARRRLGHFFDHYNHFRPHQGIGGLVPADRFFDAQGAARGEFERRMDENALRLALGEAPRRGVFLYGQIDGEPVSLHGERGRLVIQRPGRERQEISMAALGAPGGSDEHERDGDRHGKRQGDRAAERESQPSSDQEPGAAAPSHEHQDGPARAGAGAGAVGGGERRAAGARPPAGDGDARVLGGGHEQVRGGGETGRDAAARMADEPDGGGGDGVRAAAAAALQKGAERDTDGPRERPRAAAPGAREDAPGTRCREAADRSSQDAAGQRRPEDRAVVSEQEGGDERVATDGLLRPPESGPEERRREEEAHDSTLWWESAWGDIFDAWEADGERER